MNKRDNIVPFTLAFKNLPEYDGHPLTQLQQEFKKAIRDILIYYDSVNKFLEDLNLEFGTNTGTSYLLIQLKQMEQGKNESVSDFGQRIQRIEQTLLSIYDATDRTSKAERERQTK